MHLLDKQYVLIVDDEEFELSLDEVNKAKIENVLIHPDRGEAVEDFLSHLYLFFSPSASGKDVFGGSEK